MNSLQKLLVCLLLGFVVISYGCKKDDDPVGCNWATEVQDESNNLSIALEAYSADLNNPVKCQAYKDAFTDYLNALEDHKECATVSGQQGELQTAIDSARASLDALQC